MTLKFALLGAGRIGKVHARAISGNRDAELAVVADASAEAAEAISQQYGCRISTIEDIAADASIEGVIICTPTTTHADLIEKFARAGKAIFCEKPVDLDVVRAQACLEVVRETGTRLMLGFQRRYDPHFLAVKEALSKGRVGEIEMIQIISRDPGAPPMDYIRTSGGIFRDMTIHDFDMARFLLGEEPVTVYATGSVLTDKALAGVDFDSASVTMTTASGKHCTISNSRRATYGYDQRVEVHGSKGTISVENQRPAAIELATADGFTRPALHDFFMTRYIEAYAAEIAAFVAVVRDGATPSPNGEDGLRALMLADAAFRSAKEGVVVAL